jgi:hypothetical protein
MPTRVASRVGAKHKATEHPRELRRARRAKSSQGNREEREGKAGNHLASQRRESQAQRGGGRLYYGTGEGERVCVLSYIYSL